MNCPFPSCLSAHCLTRACISCGRCSNFPLCHSLLLCKVLQTLLPIEFLNQQHLHHTWIHIYPVPGHYIHTTQVLDSFCIWASILLMASPPLPHHWLHRVCLYTTPGSQKFSFLSHATCALRMEQTMAERGSLRIDTSCLKTVSRHHTAPDSHTSPANNAPPCTRELQLCVHGQSGRQSYQLGHSSLGAIVHGTQSCSGHSHQHLGGLP